MEQVDPQTDPNTPESWLTSRWTLRMRRKFLVETKTCFDHCSQLQIGFGWFWGTCGPLQEGTPLVLGFRRLGSPFVLIRPPFPVSSPFSVLSSASKNFGMPRRPESSSSPLQASTKSTKILKRKKANAAQRSTTHSQAVPSLSKQINSPPNSGIVGCSHGFAAALCLEPLHSKNVSYRFCLSWAPIGITALSTHSTRTHQASPTSTHVDPRCAVRDVAPSTAVSVAGPSRRPAQRASRRDVRTRGVGCWGPCLRKKKERVSVLSEWGVPNPPRP